MPIYPEDGTKNITYERGGEFDRNVSYLASLSFFEQQFKTKDQKILYVHNILQELKRKFEEVQEQETEIKMNLYFASDNNIGSLTHSLNITTNCFEDKYIDGKNSSEYECPS